MTLGALYTFIKYFGGALMRVFYRIRVVGKENIPQGGGYILCCNHTHFMDVAFLVPAFPKKIRFMAKQELFEKPFGRWFVTHMGGFPVVRGSGGAAAIKKAEDILRDGEILGIFPEGTRSKDGRPQKAKSGVAVIASETNAPALPVSIYYEGKLRLFKRVTVRIGKEIPAESLKLTDNDRRELRRVSTMIMDKITEQWEEGHCK